MLLITIFVPLFNFLALGLCGRYIGQTGTVHLITYTNSFALMSFCYQIFLFFINPEIVLFSFGYWVRVGLFEIEWEFIFDCIAFLIVLIVIVISISVQVYSFGYIWRDPHFIRFISYLNLFTFFILILITAANLIQFFIGWEGVGICSYLLINFWSTRIQANKAAIKAILLNRIGDIAFLTGTALTFIAFKSVDFITLPVFTTVAVKINMYYSYELFPLVSHFNGSLKYDYVAIAFFVAVCAKSAQFGLHIWLPVAIEGPTPVSALIHAATIVTAGIFLILRIAPVFELSHLTRLCAIVVGLLTIISASLTAIVSYDLKKIIAYSTCSQLGYIVVACGLSAYSLAFFHLLTHAFFKAILFLSAGVIIHLCGNEQDVRKLSMGFSSKFLLVAFTISNFALLGLPFFAGYYSKELIVFSSCQINNNFFISLIVFSALLTTIYSLRLMFYLFFKPTRSPIFFYSINKQNAALTYPIIFLIVFSIFAGYFLSYLITNPMGALLIGSLFISPLYVLTKIKPLPWRNNWYAEYVLNIINNICNEIVSSNKTFLNEQAELHALDGRVKSVLRVAEAIINSNAVALFEQYEGWFAATFKSDTLWVAPLTYYPQKTLNQRNWVIISDAGDEWKFHTLQLPNQPYFTKKADILEYYNWKIKVGDNYESFMTDPLRTDFSTWPLLPEYGWGRLVEIWTDVGDRGVVDYKNKTKLEYLKDLYQQLGPHDQQRWLSQILVSTFEEELWRDIIAYESSYAQEWVVPACFSEHLRLYIDSVGDPIGHAITRWELGNLIRLRTYEIAYWQFKDLNPPPLSIQVTNATVQEYIDWYMLQGEYSPYTDYLVNCLNIIGTALNVEDKYGEFEKKFPLEVFCQTYSRELNDQTNELIKNEIPVSEIWSQFFINSSVDAIPVLWKNFLFIINIGLFVGFAAFVYHYKTWNRLIFCSYVAKTKSFSLWQTLWIVGPIGAIVVWWVKYGRRPFWRAIYQIFSRNFYINDFFNFSAFLYLYIIKKYIYNNLDKGIIERFGPRGIFWLFVKVSNFIYYRVVQISLFYHLNFFLISLTLFVFIACFLL